MIDTKALRSRVLELAIRGKLTEQLPSDGTAEELYQQIQADKQKLIKEGKIKKEKPLPPVSPEEVPFEIPDNWMWVRFDEISNILCTGLIRSGKEQYKEAEYYYFKMQNICNYTGKCNYDDMVMINASQEEFEKTKLEEGDFLFNTRNSAELVGKTAVVHNMPIPKIILNNNILKIQFYGHINPDYINYYFISSVGRKLLYQFVSSTTNVAAIYQRQIVTLPLTLPPLAEQKRIVERVEEIFKLLDTIDAAQEKYTADVESLKAKLITAGIQGKLTEQLDSDGTAEELYQQIQEEKQKLIKEGKIKKEKPLPAIKDEEIPFEIPGNWKWVRMNEITIKITDGTHHSPINTESGDFMYVTAKNIKDKGVDLSNITYVTKEVHDEIYARCNPELNDVLLIKDGATTGVVTVNNIDEPFSLLSSVALIKPVHELVESWYIAYVLRSPLFYKTIRAQMTGTGITRIVLRQIEPFIVPLPPLAEQKRIAEVLERAMGAVDRL